MYEYIAQLSSEHEKMQYEYSYSCVVRQEHRASRTRAAAIRERI